MSETSGDIYFGRMQCPNCGIERDTTDFPCMCGYNPQTGKVEKSPLAKCIDELEDLVDSEELNLCNIVKVGDVVYSPAFGFKKIHKIRKDRLCDEEDCFICYSNGRIYNKGEVIVFPTKELYLKYPLNPIKAWMEYSQASITLEKEVEGYAKSCILKDDIDDRSYSIAISSIRRGLELARKYSQKEVKEYLNKTERK